MRVALLLSMIALASATGCGEDAPRATPPRTSPDAGLDRASADAALLEAVGRAYRLEATPRSIGRVIGARPTVDTARESDREVIAAADYAIDPSAPAVGPSPAQWLRAMDVAYWTRPLDGADGNRRIIGMAWYPDGRREVFYAEVLPP